MSGRETSPWTEPKARGWHAEAPSLTIEARRWLGEVAACVWLAAQRVEVGDQEAP